MEVSRFCCYCFGPFPAGRDTKESERASRIGERESEPRWARAVRAHGPPSASLSLSLSRTAPLNRPQSRAAAAAAAAFGMQHFLGTRCGQTGHARFSAGAPAGRSLAMTNLLAIGSLTRTTLCTLRPFERLAISETAST